MKTQYNWYTNTTYTTSVALLREGEKYYQECKLFERYRTFQRFLSSVVTKHWALFKFTGKNELTNSKLTDTPIVSIFLFSRAVIKQFINWPINKLFWDTIWNLSCFFACKPRVDEFIKTFDKNFVGLTSTLQAKWHRPSKIIFQRIMWRAWGNAHFFITVIKAQ